jgi:hypothetical protein
MSHEPKALQKRRDEDLAAYTDTLMERRPGEIESDRPPLAETVRTLARALHPKPPPDELRRRIRARISAEWPKRFASRSGHPRFSSPIRVPRWAWAAVSLLFLITVSAILLAPPRGSEISGTAVGDAWTAAAVVGAILLLGGLIGAWLASRRR